MRSCPLDDQQVRDQITELTRVSRDGSVTRPVRMAATVMIKHYGEVLDVRVAAMRGETVRIASLR